MGITKAVDLDHALVKESPKASSVWSVNYPNPADFNFNYRYLLEQCTGGIGVAPSRLIPYKIAVVGAGIAGLTAARELVRSGYQVDLYEAQDHIGGRHDTRVSNDPDTPFEMAAMRMPFFSDHDSTAPKENSILGYLKDLFAISTQPFPNPGSAVVATTGVYLKNGSTTTPAPGMIMWPGGQNIPDANLQAVKEAWTRFQDRATTYISKKYTADSWSGTIWPQIVSNYYAMSFRDLALTEPYTGTDKPGWFGGLGLTEEQANLFYSIGAGDGSWGAFFSISCLYPMRTFLFGFGNELQLIQGFYQGGKFNPGPHVGDKSLKDSNGTPLPPPLYKGVKSFDDGLFYCPSTVDGKSLYDLVASKSEHFSLYLDRPVTEIAYKTPTVIAPRQIELTAANQTTAYDAVVLTMPSWALQMSCKLTNFSPSQLPWDVRQYLNTAHWESSCKVFVNLKDAFWTDGKIPQLIVTDTFIQDLYAYKSDMSSTNGVLLLSYTWEDDATKLGYLGDTDLVAACLAKADEITLGSLNVATAISQYVDSSQPQVVHWEKVKYIQGCAKLYRPGALEETVDLLSYNQSYSAQSGIYFAGEGYSVEGGWTEPALRMALDAVIHIINNTNGTFNGGFSMGVYPKFFTGPFPNPNH